MTRSRYYLSRFPGFEHGGFNDAFCLNVYLRHSHKGLLEVRSRAVAHGLEKMEALGVGADGKSPHPHPIYLRPRAAAFLHNVSLSSQIQADAILSSQGCYQVDRHHI